MEMDDLFKAGSDIMRDVSQAVESGDYSYLSGAIKEHVTQVTDQFGQEVAQGARKFADSMSQGTASGGPKGRNYFLQRKPNRNAGVGKKIAGIVLAVMQGSGAAIWLLSAILLGFTGDGAAVALAIVFALLSAAITAGFAVLARNGKKQQQLVTRYYQYGELIGTDQEFFPVAELALKAGVSEEQVRDDIAKMRAAGYLPYAVLDRSKTTVILTDRMYKQYANAEKSRKAREEEERIRNLQSAAAPQGQAKSWESAEKRTAEAEAMAHLGAAGKAAAGVQGNLSEDQASLLREGQSYIIQIRVINDRIPDTEVMSDKLYQLEDIMQRIFTEVKKNPAKTRDLRKLMNYYLPTTTKLLSAYADLNEQPEAGENIRETKRQIEASMDMINDAFGKLLDNMFQEQAWDLSSDLNVMKTMMAQDGLTESYVMNSQGEKVPASEAENL